MALDDYQPNENNGDSLKPSEIIDHLLIVRIRQRKEGIVTQYTPEGGPGVIVDVVDLDAVDTTTGQIGPQAYSDVLWMNGAIVDNLTPNVGKTIAIRLVWATGKSGRNYVSIEAADEAGKAKAGAHLTANPDPWSQLADIAPTTTPTVSVPAQNPALAATAQPTIAIPENLSPEQLEQLKAMGVQVPVG
jgi:hypothetical protein